MKTPAPESLPFKYEDLQPAALLKRGPGAGAFQ